jgi:AraC-like DNA-binding protein
MQRERTTSATTLRLLTAALEDLGEDWRPILRACNIDPACIEDPEARIAQERFDSVWKAASTIANDPCIGLHAGERIHPRAVNLFGYLMLSSATLGDGIQRVARYQDVLTGQPWLRLVEGEAPSTRICVGIVHADPDSRAIHAEYVAALLLQVMNWVSEQPIEPLAVRFSHAARADVEEYRRVLRGSVYFGSERSEMTFAPGVLELPSQHANARFARLHEQYAAELLASQRDTSVAERVRKQLASGLESGPPDRSSVARSLGLSDRSLQRRLRDEGTKFRSVLDEWRKDLARQQLQQHDLPVAEVAYLTGFSEVSSFTRAVRRWFGCTPRQLRVQAVASDGLSRTVAG